MRYAKRVKNDPTKSIIYDQKNEIEALFGSKTTLVTQFTTQLRLALFVFAACFIIMIIGVSMLDW